MSRIHVLLASVLFGTTGTAQALGPEADPLTVGAIRIAIGATLLVAVAAFVVRERTSAPWHRGAVLAGGAGVAAYQLCFFAAVDATGVAVGTVVAIGSAPALAGLLGRVVSGDALGGRWALATLLACAGVVVLVLASGDVGDVDALGVLLALGAGASYATYTVAAKRLLTDGHGTEDVMARAFGLGALLLLPVLALADASWLSTADGLAMAAFLGAVPTAAAYLLFARGLRHLAAGEVATLTLAEPVTATALGVLVLGERPGAAAVAGVVLVLAGLAVLAAPDRRRRRAVPAAAV